MDQKFDIVVDYKDSLHTEEDLRLSLLAGATIKIGNIEIKPYTIGEIVQDHGYSKYLSVIRGVMLELSDINLGDTNPEMVSLLQEHGAYTMFDLYYRFLGDDFRLMLKKGLEVILRTDQLVLDPNKDFITVGEYDPESDSNVIINRDNFEKIIRVVKLQNYLEMDLGQAIEDEIDGVDEATRELMRFQKEMREKLKLAKKNSGDDSEVADFSSIVSAITTKSQHINKSNVWGMTLYQIYDELNRLIMIDDYLMNIKAIMAGAKDVKITHWSAPVETEK